ncbi:MAG: hypothetical protein A2X32_06720 [Elusimicrobia bacterium GWC2_64_44]|nr:MAG: hypothetical protein A2X32_06720 [Elusimicrobia bacterium GWC2_64_44]
MRKIFLAALTLSVFPVFSDAQDPALAQLIGEPSAIEVPQAPLPDRGGAVDYTLGWDESAPLSYAQRPAEIVPGKDGLAVIRTVRTGRTPADHKSYAWETVTVNAALIDKALYAYKTFGTGHTFLVFTFKPGGAVDSRGVNIPALTFGAEGWSREPKGYNITHALAGKYPLIWLVTTFESYADYTVNFKQKEIFFRNISIGREETLRLFGLLLARIDETNRNKETYNLFSNSCTNNPVNLLNQVLPAARRISLEVAGLMNPNASIPKYAVKKYTEKGALRAEEFSVAPGSFASFDITKI